ncbi:MAG: Mfa1 fimbrilin C-terminal domain-containing protein [Bacteroidales bacterium]|nr:Mfa1 fimbrilin C-terminal domain-containing protein [Bacteroidales bacterium]
MNYKHLLIAILAGAALVGCNKEKGGTNDGTEEIKDARYMGFTISMPSATTKAAGTTGLNTYQVGEAYENAIKTLHFFFYRNGAYVSWGYGNMASQFNSETAGAAGSNVEETRPAPYGTGNEYTGVVVLESTMAMPNQVLCVVNSRNPNWYRNKTLEQVKAVLHTGEAESLTGNVTDSFKDFQFRDGDPYFVMFTSPMYGSNANSVKEIKYVTDIYVEETSQGSGVFTANSNIQNTREDAQKHPVNIYVERMAARLEIANLSSIVDGNGFVKAEKLDDSMKDGSDPIYDIKPLAWSVIAANKKAYNLKQIKLNWWTKMGANEAFSGNWLESGDQTPNPLRPSEPMYTRINWTEDPNYGYRAALTARNHYPHSAREYTSESELKYWSATEIQAHYDAADASEGDILQRYAYENTFPAEGQKTPRINGTMLLLYAQAKKHAAADYEDLFAYMGQIYTVREYCEHLLATIAAHGCGFYWLDGSDYKPIRTSPDFTNPAKGYFKTVKATTFEEFGTRQFARFADLSTTPSANDSSKKLIDLYGEWVIDLSGSLQPKTYDAGFVDVPTSWTVTNEKGYADGYVTLVPTAACPQLYVMDTNTTTNPTYDPAVANSEYRAATDKDLVKGFLGSVVEPANKYTEGRMYYAIPIEHFGSATTAGSDPDPLEGNYGVVRNNFYQVNIGQIKSLGHGIDDVTEPIVPGDRKKPFYIAAKINILSWQLATQTADLEE